MGTDECNGEFRIDYIDIVVKEITFSLLPAITWTGAGTEHYLDIRLIYVQKNVSLCQAIDMRLRVQQSCRIEFSLTLVVLVLFPSVTFCEDKAL